MAVDSCVHRRVVLLVVAGTSYWVCNWCGAQFIPKSVVSWKIEHLTSSLAGVLLDGEDARVWKQEAFPI